MLTRSPRALRRRPMLAAVMPLPSEEVTPPVTKTYFDTGQGPPGGFSNAIDSDPRSRIAAGQSAWRSESDTDLPADLARRRRALNRLRPRFAQRVEPVEHRV